MSAEDDPFKRFEVWLKEATEAGHLQPEAMALTTSTLEGKATSRMVLFKGFINKAFTFHTNYESRKSKELLTNPQATLLFFWEKINKQIRVEGFAEKLSDADSDTYWKTRTRESRIGAWASKQSHPLQSRAELEASVQKITKQFEGTKDIPRPDFWGGFRLIPNKIEFWSAKSARLHERELFAKKGSSWERSFLYP